jgi:hypothetical protein
LLGVSNSLEKAQLAPGGLVLARLGVSRYLRFRAVIGPILDPG